MNDIEIIDCAQGTPEWHEAKLGIPSASKFSDVMAGGEGKTRSKYMRQLAGELRTGVTREDFRGAAMDRGTAQEPELISLYSMMANVEVQPIGFIKRPLRIGFAGCSPDGLIGKDGLVQIKSAAPDILIDIMKAGRVPPEHLPQCQGEMLVTGRVWCELVIGNSATGGRPGDLPMPLFRRRIKRDPSYIARLTVAIETFNEELAEMVEWLRRYGKESAP